MRKLLPILLFFPLFYSSCTTNAVTGRKQLNILPEGQLQQMALTEYKTFLSQSKVVPNNASNNAEMVRRVGSRISNSITKYYSAKGKSKILEGYKWEFNLVDNKEVNAWCLPGGKIVFYSAILPICKDDAGMELLGRSGP